MAQFKTIKTAVELIQFKVQEAKQREMNFASYREDKGISPEKEKSFRKCQRDWGKIAAYLNNSVLPELIELEKNGEL